MVGNKISSIRTAKSISVETLAERSGLSVNQVNSIENNEVLPSLSPLIKIARVLGVRIGTFLDDNNNIGPVVTKKEEISKGLSFSNNEDDCRASMNYLTLAGNKSGRHMEPFIIEIEPCGTGHKLSQHEGEEFIYVLEGEIEVEYGMDKYALEQGDSIYYDSIVEHHVHAKGDAKAKILAVVYVPA